MDRVYYADATTEKPDGTKCLTNYSRFGTDYGKRISEDVKPGDYHVPLKDAN